MSSLRKRARDLGFNIGSLPAGPLNAITDVTGVCVGHLTLHEEADVRTGVTAVLPHSGNLFQEKVPAGLAVNNGFGKLAGSTQVIELGEIETPVLLTNTLSVPRAAEALITWTLNQAGNENVHSVNPVVGETNDGWLNNIRLQSLTVEHCLQALETAQPGTVREGCVGAGTGTVAFGWKGGIGSSSRRLPAEQGGWTLGVLVQSNFGGELHILGRVPQRPANRLPTKNSLTELPPPGESIMIVVATDAPLSDRNLKRLATRALGGLARSGASLANNSGDYALAFSTHTGVRRTPKRRQQLSPIDDLPNDLLSPLFLAVLEATEEAIYNSIFMAVTTTGYEGHTAYAVPYPEG